MRFTESKKRIRWFIFIPLIIVVIGVFSLGFCGMNPDQKTVQKTIVFETD